MFNSKFIVVLVSSFLYMERERGRNKGINNGKSDDNSGILTDRSVIIQVKILNYKLDAWRTVIVVLWVSSRQGVTLFWETNLVCVMMYVLFKLKSVLIEYIGWIL